MKTIGLIGGLSWESSAEYYRIINQLVRARLGGHHSAKSVMVSVDFAEVVPLQHALDWEGVHSSMATAAAAVQRAGAAFVAICSCTMNSVADRVQAGLNIPVLHIADATAQEVRNRGISKVGLLGTRFTMEQDYFKGRLAQRHGIDVVVPPDEDRETVHQVIYDELVVGRVEQASRQKYAEIMRRLAERGAEAIVLGCTEIGLLVGDADSPVPTIDTTRVHAEAAVEYALQT